MPVNNKREFFWYYTWDVLCKEKKWDAVSRLTSQILVPLCDILTRTIQRTVTTLGIFLDLRIDSWRFWRSVLFMLFGTMFRYMHELFHQKQYSQYIDCFTTVTKRAYIIKQLLSIQRRKGSKLFVAILVSWLYFFSAVPGHVILNHKIIWLKGDANKVRSISPSPDGPFCLSLTRVSCAEIVASLFQCWSTTTLYFEISVSSWRVGSVHCNDVRAWKTTLVNVEGRLPKLQSGHAWRANVGYIRMCKYLSCFAYFREDTPRKLKHVEAPKSL